MERKSIPNWRRASSPTSTRCSRRSRRRYERGLWAGCGMECLKRIKGETSNIELRTSNSEPARKPFAASSEFSLRSSVFDVQGSAFYPCLFRRVMGAWWPSRSSKPLSARFTGRGMFDSYPLRHLNLRFTSCDLRFGGRHAGDRADPFTRKSQIVNRPSAKGGGGLVTRTDS